MPPKSPKSPPPPKTMRRKAPAAPTLLDTLPETWEGWRSLADRVCGPWEDTTTRDGVDYEVRRDLGGRPRVVVGLDVERDEFWFAIRGTDGTLMKTEARFPLDDNADDPSAEVRAAADAYALTEAKLVLFA